MGSEQFSWHKKWRRTAVRTQLKALYATQEIKSVINIRDLLLRKALKKIFIIHQQEPLQDFLCYLVTAMLAAWQHIANYRRTSLQGNNNHSVVCHCIILHHTLDTDYHHVLRTDSEQTHLHSWADNYSPQSTSFPCYKDNLKLSLNLKHFFPPAWPVGDTTLIKSAVVMSHLRGDLATYIYVLICPSPSQHLALERFPVFYRPSFTRLPVCRCFQVGTTPGL